MQINVPKRSDYPNLQSPSSYLFKGIVWGEGQLVPYPKLAKSTDTQMLKKSEDEFASPSTSADNLAQGNHLDLV